MSEYNLFTYSQEITEQKSVESEQASDRPQEPKAPSMLKKIVEALLFTSCEPLSFEKIKETIEQHYPVQTKQLRRALSELAVDYETQGRAFSLEEIARGFVLRTRELFADFIDTLYRDKRSEKLSPAALEVLAIVAYRQPITRPQIEALRGVDCSGVMQTLLERGLIATRGRLEGPGRAALYVTTSDFLRHFGLKDPSQLPHLDEV